MQGVLEALALNKTDCAHSALQNNNQCHLIYYVAFNELLFMVLVKQWYDIYWYIEIHTVCIEDMAFILHKTLWILYVV